MPLADQGDVEAILRRSHTAAETTHLPRLLEMAEARAERWCGRRFAQVVDDVVTVGKAGDRELFLPSPPVDSIASIVVAGSTLAASTYEVTTAGHLTSLYGWWGGPLTVTYTHGFAEIPADVAFGVAALVAEVLDAPGVGVQSETTSADDFSFTTRYATASRAMRVEGSSAEEALAAYRLTASSVEVAVDEDLLWQGTGIWS